MKVVWKIIYANEERDITWFSSPKKPIELDDDVREFFEGHLSVFHPSGFAYKNDQVAVGEELYEVGYAFNTFLRMLDREWKSYEERRGDDEINMFEVISITPRDPRFPNEKGTNNYTIY
tara:strand:+ start:237 stop:593 length:357 start_codon:yes stop_codon:yes gene_type:complete